MKPVIMYRTSGAVRWTLDLNAGRVWAEFAPALNGKASGRPKAGERRYEWERKVTIALSPEECFRIAAAARRVALGLGLPEPLQLFHDPTKGGGEGKPKTLALREGGPQSKAAAYVEGGQNGSKVTIALGHADLLALETLLALAAARLLGWA